MGDEAYRSAGEADGEGAPMLPVSHAHARHGSLGGGKAAPHHALGSGSDDDEPSSPSRARRRSSGGSGDSMSSFADLDAQAASLLDEFDASAAEAHSLTRLSERDKARQHEGDRIAGLEGLVSGGGGGGEEDEVERERKELEGAFEREDERRRRRDLLGDDL